MVSLGGKELKGTVSRIQSEALTGFEHSTFCSRSQHLFSVGSVHDNDRPKAYDVEVAGHSTNTYLLARSFRCKGV